MEVKRWGGGEGCKAECAEWHQFHPENADSGGKFAARSMDVIGRPSVAAPTLLFMSFFSSQYTVALL